MLDPKPRLPRDFRLNNGDVIPAIGVGCWMGKQGEGDHVISMVKTALVLGYRHIDTVSDEASVGQGIRESGVPRSELYITTKLASEDHWDPMSALETSLAKLGLDYVDLYLMHWPMALRADGSAVQPNETPTYIETWHAMQEVLKTGKTRAIGVSNLSQRLLSDLLAHPKTTIVPAVNQVEAHPCLPQHELRKFCRDKGILLGVQRGTAVVPKSVREERLIQNSSVIELSQDDMQLLDRLHLKQGMHRSVCGFHSLESGGSCFGWTYEQLGWGFCSGGIMRQ
ncbi:Aldo/keto reductase [Macrolepiota fuliginosa MF-IS2]|uniref:Aldo/keto reductase n=1 Tax=Macrolepiota fuliginosa MF-IS2 TaxID=1400762 RepID=A0A9P6C3K5_9AGAR|nr:Aldo/keto reductase [Macrolepiota fuliginosa MF-IS2]